MKQLILASGSPRRRELMKMIGADFEVITSDCDERIDGNPAPSDLVGILARRKAPAVFNQHPDAIVIGADTIVCLDGHILGKPRDRSDAIDTLLSLSGREHIVYTGLAVIGSDRAIVDVSATRVEFVPLTRAECERYADTGEPMDKAGSYGIQGRGGMFVSRIDGDYFNVVGLPISRLRSILKDSFGIELL